MLEQVGEAAAAARLQAKSNVVIDADGGHRRGAVRRYDHAQAIFEFGAFQGNVQWFQNRSFKLALPIVSLRGDSIAAERRYSASLSVAPVIRRRYLSRRDGAVI